MLEPRHAIPVCIALLAGSVLPVAHAFAATADELSARADPPRQYIYGWLGALDAGNAWTANDPDDGRATSDLGTLPFGGAASQRIRGDRFQYGYEGGGLITWKSRRSAFLATSNELRVKVRSSLFVIDLFMGGIVAVQPVDWLRLSLSAGPSLGWGWADHDRDDTEDPDGTGGVAGEAGGFRLVLNSSDNDFSLGAYGRAAAEVQLRNGLSVGISARYTDHRYDFGREGDLELDGVQWLLTLGRLL